MAIMTIDLLAKVTAAEPLFAAVDEARAAYARAAEVALAECPEGPDALAWIDENHRRVSAELVSDRQAVRDAENALFSYFWKPATVASIKDANRPRSLRRLQALREEAAELNAAR